MFTLLILNEIVNEDTDLIKNFDNYEEIKVRMKTFYQTVLNLVSKEKYSLGTIA